MEQSYNYLLEVGVFDDDDELFEDQFESAVEEVSF